MTTATVNRVNGSAGHPPAPLRLVPFVPSGPVSPWPRQEDTPGQRAAAEDDSVTVTKAPRFPPRLRGINGDTVITWSMAATVALVAVDAAIVSYSHIYGLATGQWGSGAETGIQARLLPLSIDGVIFEASLVKLYAARHKIVRGHPRKRLRMPSLSTCMLWLGITATVAANVTHGLPSSMISRAAHMVIMALLSAWPAGALIGSVEMSMGLVRDKHAVASAGDSDGDTASDTEDDTVSDTDDTGTAGQGDSERDTESTAQVPRQAVRPRRAVARKPSADPVTDAIRKGWDDDRIIARHGVTKRTVQRRRAALAKPSGATP